MQIHSLLSLPQIRINIYYHILNINSLKLTDNLLPHGMTVKSPDNKHIVNNTEAELILTKESSGTKKLFSLLPLIVSALTEGKTLIVDELDSKLHPLLLKYIINLFSDMNINRNKAQLIFTSHDLSTMNSEVFRRDEMWFVAKGTDQNSQFYSLVEFKNDKGASVRKDAKFDKQYLEDKYSAIPSLKNTINRNEVY